MLRQFEAIKSQHRDAILLFRLGDFYEMFGADARDGARLLGLTLTQRQGTPMCGVPHHAARSYIARLLELGRKVAICEQVGEPDGRTLTERRVVEVVSPGSVYEPDFLDSRANNYLVAAAVERDTLALGWCDVSTGELTLAAFPAGGEPDAALDQILARLSPREILLQESLVESSRVAARLVRRDSGIVANRIPDWSFSIDAGERRLSETLAVRNLAGFGFSPGDAELFTAAPLLDYLEHNARHALGHLHTVRRFREDDVVVLDEATIRSLELVRSMRDDSGEFTLLAVIDQCRTAMGSRLLRRSLLAPPRDRGEIERRLDRVEALYIAQGTLERVRRLLDDGYDLERLVGRLGVEKAHPKDLIAIARTVTVCHELAEVVPEVFPAPPGDGAAQRDLIDRILATLDDDPPIAVSDGGVIRDGADPEVDRLRALSAGSRQVLEEYLETLRRSTGIGSLKLKYNRMLGHFLELPRSQASRVPEEFIRRQTLATAERFTTTRLSELETEINNASDAAREREQELFLALRERVAGESAALLSIATWLAECDMLAALASCATRSGYRRPRLVDEPIVAIDGGRHPVVEAHMPSGSFVSNDVHLGNDARFALITGPNMAGKSTVLRQTALIAILAHVGSFVPADDATIGTIDRIFCRVGANDNIARGESTFLVEMSETSNILRNATAASLVVMDEVGRGTSTHDGLAIAWAVVEHLLERIAARTLFATHYHELAGIDHPDLVHLAMAVRHTDDEVVFLKKLRPGTADRSYGVDVARLAGLPDTVIARARVLLAEFESGAAPAGRPAAEVGLAHASRTGSAAHASDTTLPGLFSAEELLATELRGLDPDSLTPREALDLIYRWRTSLGR